MPIEVSPIPFAGLQLPYTPKFARPQIDGVGINGADGSLPGPASAAASAIIPPQPGGIASPHRAIPALSETGYTPLPMRGPIGYGPQSMYSASLYDGGPGHQQYGPPGPMSMMQSDGWGHSSLPAPRRGPPGPIPMPQGPIAPAGRLQRDHGDDERGAHHHHHHHHHHEHSGRSHRDQSERDFDNQSDASYYSKPRTGRRRADSVSSSQSDQHSPRMAPREQDGNDHHHHHHHRSPSLPPSNHDHSPVSPSPLSLAGRAAVPLSSSPLSPTRERHQSSPDREDGPRPRTVSRLVPEKERKEHRPKINRHASLDSGKHDGEHRESHHHQSRHHHEEKRQTSDSETDVEQHEPRRRHHSYSHHHDRQQERHHDHHDHHDHRDQEYERRPSQRAPSPSPVGPGMTVGQAASFDDSHFPLPRQPYRRRAVSMQFDNERPLPMDAQTMYQTPSVAGFGPTQAYDDGASVAGSGMTFMDGSVGGRVSQYGLPKYAHIQKPDYRRYCVQRGTADVFLD